MTTTHAQQQVDYYRLHPDCTDEYIRAALDLSASVSASDLSYSYDPKLRDAYMILMNAYRIATEELALDRPASDSRKLRSDARQFKDRADKIANVLKEHEEFFDSHFTTGALTQVTKGSDETCVGLLKFAKDYLNWHERWPQFSAAHISEMSDFDTYSMEVYVGALELRLGIASSSSSYPARSSSDQRMFELFAAFQHHQDHLKEYIEAMDEDHERRCATPTINSEDVNQPPARAPTPVYAGDV